MNVYSMNEWMTHTSVSLALNFSLNSKFTIPELAKQLHLDHFAVPSKPQNPKLNSSQPPLLQLVFTFAHSLFHQVILVDLVTGT
jgi:hypothetical protein